MLLTKRKFFVKFFTKLRVNILIRFNKREKIQIEKFSNLIDFNG